MEINIKLRGICVGSGVRQSGPGLTPEKSAAQTAREERLAKALRENLRRRKEQQRAQRQEATQSEEPDLARERPA